MAETFVAMPFLVITVEGALRSADQGFEEAAAHPGRHPDGRCSAGSPLPLVAPSLGAGAVLCWARALGEFGATITFAGSFPGRTETMPIAVYYALENDPDAAIALSLVLLRGLGRRAGLAAGPLAPRRSQCNDRAETAVTGPRVDGRCSRGAFRLDVAFEVPPGAGARRARAQRRGKTTLLRALAGLAPVADGRITFGGTRSTTRRRAVPRPRAAAVGFVFQDYRLFPHLTVRRQRRVRAARPRRAGRRPAAAAAGSTGSASPTWPAEPARAVRRPGAARRPGPGAGRRPDAAAARRAAGGAGRPDPAGGADRTPSTWRTFPGPCLLVTHDPLEALVLADRLLVLEDGRIVQDGTPPSVARQPATEYVARLVA